MPRRRQGYNLTHVLIALLVMHGTVRERTLRKILRRGVYPYLRRLRQAGVVDYRDGVVTLSPGFRELINAYVRGIEEIEKAGSGDTVKV